MTNPAILAARTVASSITHEETWLREHRQVQWCWRLEDFLSHFNSSLFPSFLEIVDYWNSDACTSEPTSEDDERLFEEAIQNSAKACGSILDLINEVEKDGHSLDGADLFRSNYTKLGEAAKEIERIAKVEARMGYRGVTMEPGAAESLKRILDLPRESTPRPTRDLKQIPLTT